MDPLYQQYHGTRYESGTPSAMTAHVTAAPPHIMHETIYAHQAGEHQLNTWQGAFAPAVPHSLGPGRKASPASQRAYGDTTTPGYQWMATLQAPRMFGSCQASNGGR